MVYLDKIIIPITEEMITLAKVDAESLKSSIGQKTRNATELRDITGSLAHQVVEKKLEEMRRPFESYRLERRTFGDRGDIKYENDLIDVKGQKKVWNNQFLIFDKEMESINRKGITHFCFVEINYEDRVGVIYGVIDIDDFKEKSIPVRLMWDNHAISIKHLKPFINYINRSN